MYILFKIVVVLVFYIDYVYLGDFFSCIEIYLCFIFYSYDIGILSLELIFVFNYCFILN